MTQVRLPKGQTVREDGTQSHGARASEPAGLPKESSGASGRSNHRSESTDAPGGVACASAPPSFAGVQALRLLLALGALSRRAGRPGAGLRQHRPQADARQPRAGPRRRAVPAQPGARPPRPADAARRTRSSAAPPAATRPNMVDSRFFDHTVARRLDDGRPHPPRRLHQPRPRAGRSARTSPGAPAASPPRRRSTAAG